MTPEEAIQIWTEYCDSEYIKFDRIEHPRSKRPDLCAFMMLDAICPGTRDILGSAHHDEIFLSLELDDLAPRLTKETIVDLLRCGVRFATGCESLAMFV